MTSHDMNHNLPMPTRREFVKALSATFGAFYLVGCGGGGGGSAAAATTTSGTGSSTNSGSSGSSGSSVLPPTVSYGNLATASSTMSAASWLDVTASTNVQAVTDTTGPETQAIAWLESARNYYLTNWPGKCTFDAARNRVMLTGAAQGFSSEKPAGAHSAAVYLDLASGALYKQWNPMGRNLAHVYDSNPSIPLNGKVYRRPFNSNELFQCEDTTWSLATTFSGISLSSSIALEVFPELGTSGSVLLLADGGKLYRWDVATQAVSTIGTYSGLGGYPVMHYVPGGNYIVFGGGNLASTFYKLDAGGNVTQIASTLPSGVTGTGAGVGSAMCADPSAGSRSWLLSNETTKLYSLDHATGLWTDHGGLPTGMNYSATMLSALHGTGTILFVSGRGRANDTTSLSGLFLYHT